MTTGREEAQHGYAKAPELQLGCGKEVIPYGSSP